MPNRRRHRLLLPLLAVALALGACHRGSEEPASGGDTPAKAMQALLERIGRNDFAGFWRQALPPGDYAAMRADWKRHAAQPSTLPANDRDRFNHTLHALTATDAKAILARQWLPQLAEAERTYGDQLPILVGIGHALVVKGVAASRTLDAPQKKNVIVVLDALTPWAAQASWFDPDRARQTIGITVDTARALHLDSADQLHRLDFDSAMHAYGTVFDGLRKALAVYGLSLDAIFASITVTTVETHPEQATVRMAYRLFDKPLTAEARMVRIDGRWYSQAVVDAARRRHAEAQHPPTPATATAVVSVGAR